MYREGRTCPLIKYYLSYRILCVFPETRWSFSVSFSIQSPSPSPRPGTSNSNECHLPTLFYLKSCLGMREDEETFKRDLKCKVKKAKGERLREKNWGGGGLGRGGKGAAEEGRRDINVVDLVRTGS